MAKLLTPEDVLFRQRFLSCCGFYRDRLDGQWGDRTDAADKEFFRACEMIASQETRFDARTERNIQSLQCDAQRAARRAMKAILDGGIEARIISGTRSYAEQNALFAQGRFGNPGPKVTNARAGQSWHNFGLAWDIGVFRNGVYLANENAPYRAAGAIGRGIAGVEWGGDWKSFKDLPHYQLGQAAAGVNAARARFERGGRDA